MKRSQQLI